MNFEKYLLDIFCLRYRLFKKAFKPSKELTSTGLKFAVVNYSDTDFCEEAFEKLQKNLNKQTFQNFAVFKQYQEIPPNYTHICFIKQGDILPKYALNELAVEIQDNNDKKIFYSDCEYLNKFNQPTKYHFKPEFDKYMFYSFDYLSTGLLAIKNLPEFDFRNLNYKKIYQVLLANSENAEIFHRIPKVLYSRKNKNKTSYPNITKYHLQKVGFAAQVKTENVYNKIEFTPISKPKISIIMPFKDKVDFLKTIIKSIEEKSTYKNYEIILVNNRSTEKETLDFVSKTKHRVIDADFDFNYSRVCNFGAEHAKGEYLLFINNDMEVIDPRWLENMVSLAQRDEVGVVGTKLIFGNDTIQHAGAMATDRKVYNLFAKMKKDGKSYFNYHNILRETQALIGACHMVSKAKFDSVGGYDENYIIEYSDSELCFKLIEQGYKSIYVPNAAMYHYEGTSRRGKWKQEIKKDKVLFMSRYLDTIYKYRCYNPNLSTYRRQFFHSKIK